MHPQNGCVVSAPGTGITSDKEAPQEKPLGLQKLNCGLSLHGWEAFLEAAWPPARLLPAGMDLFDITAKKPHHLLQI